MRRNLIISILFFIATTIMAAHEVQHIEHDSASCEICVLVNNLVSSDIVIEKPRVEILHFGSIDIVAKVIYFHKQSITCHSRAPPIFS